MKNKKIKDDRKRKGKRHRREAERCRVSDGGKKRKKRGLEKGTEREMEKEKSKEEREGQRGEKKDKKK